MIKPSVLITLFLVLALAGVTYFIYKGNIVALFSGASNSPVTTYNALLVKYGSSGYEPCNQWHDQALTDGLNADYGLVKTAEFNSDRFVCVTLVVANSTLADPLVNQNIFAQGVAGSYSPYRLLYATKISTTNSAK